MSLETRVPGLVKTMCSQLCTGEQMCSAAHAHQKKRDTEISSQICPLSSSSGDMFGGSELGGAGGDKSPAPSGTYHPNGDSLAPAVPEILMENTEGRSYLYIKSNEQNTWEPVDNMQACDKLVETFENNLTKQKAMQQQKIAAKAEPIIAPPRTALAPSQKANQ
ncbi:unnamed protein product, partial [Timema podura]|nr:unnamed protein product [Timema podura]